MTPRKGVRQKKKGLKKKEMEKWLGQRADLHFCLNPSRVQVSSVTTLFKMAFSMQVTLLQGHGFSSCT